MNNSKYLEALRAISVQQKNPPVSDEDLEEMVWMDSCGGYYCEETSGFYSEDGEYQGDFKTLWGDEPYALDPEVFGMDSSEFEDPYDLAFWTVRDTKAYCTSKKQDSPEVIEEVIAWFVDQEGIDDIVKFSAEILTIPVAHSTPVERLVIHGYHTEVGPVWSSYSRAVTFPTNYVEVSNAFLDIAEYMHTMQNLTYGCASCWRTQNVCPIDEISEEYVVSEDTVEDIMDACDSKELKFMGPIQPDCPICQGAGIAIIGGHDAL
jgi:hypothetical protein